MDEDRREDKELARRLLEGDKGALREFYQGSYSRLLSHVASRVKRLEDAEEIVQDAFLGFLDSLPLFSYRSSLWTFLVSICRHEIADYYRRLYAKKALKYVPFVDQVYQETLYGAEETAELFDKALARLRPWEQKVLVWKYEDEMSVKEIALNLGMSVKAAESRIFRARAAFKLEYASLNNDQ